MRNTRQETAKETAKDIEAAAAAAAGLETWVRKFKESQELTMRRFNVSQDLKLPLLFFPRFFCGFRDFKFAF